MDIKGSLNPKGKVLKMDSNFITLNKLAATGKTYIFKRYGREAIIIKEVNKERD